MGQTKTKGYSFQMEILVRAWKQNRKIIEQPIIFVDRLYGKSKLGPNEVFIYLQGVAKLFLDYWNWTPILTELKILKIFPRLLNFNILYLHCIKLI